MLRHKAFVLASRPKGAPTPADFRLIEEETREPGEGEVLVRHHFLSLDPYMRGRMDDARSYAPPHPLGEVMIGGTVGEVVSSRSPRLKPGDLVVGYGGWQLYAVAEAGSLRRVEPSRLPLSAHLGVVGMPGVTAWYGINRIIAPKAGETVLVSAATGAVGAVAGQLAKRAGCRTVAIAGGATKCAHATQKLGYAAAVDLSEAGHNVRFWRRDAAAFAPVLKTGIVTVKDHAGKRDVKIAKPTNITSLNGHVMGFQPPVPERSPVLRALTKWS